MAFFGKAQYSTIKSTKKREIPQGLWQKCQECKDMVYKKSLEDPSLRWLKLENDRYVPFALPVAGKSVVLRGRGFEDVVKDALNGK